MKVKKRRTFKEVEKIENKTDQQLEEIKDQEERQLQEIRNYDTEKKSFKQLEYFDGKQQQRDELTDELRQANKKSKKEKTNGNFLCVHTNGRRYDFNRFATLEQLYYDIFSGKTTIKEAKDE